MQGSYCISARGSRTTGKSPGPVFAERPIVCVDVGVRVPIQDLSDRLGKLETSGGAVAAQGIRFAGSRCLSPSLSLRAGWWCW